MNKLTRAHDWQTRFSAFLAQRQSMPFAWGGNDCCTCAADLVLALTGVDAAADLRGYSTAKEAYRALQKIGGVEALATAALGQPRRAVFAQIGDIVMVKIGKRDALAICNGSTALAPSAAGLVTVGFEHDALCWRVA